MRKLTVKNFSVIRDAELEFGKITVLIGPQSSGKSLLCKLAYFLGRKVVGIAVDRVVNRFEFPAFESAIREEFAKWFPSAGWGAEDWMVEFRSQDYWLRVTAPSSQASNSEPNLEFAEIFQKSYLLRLKKTSEDEIAQGFAPLIEGLRSLASTEFEALGGRGVWDASTYIPVERSYFVDTTRGYKALGAEGDPVVAQFAEVFANSLSGVAARPRVSNYLGGDLVSWPGGWMLAFRDGRLLPLAQASSGSKELLPILSVLDYYEHRRRQSGRLVSAELYGKILYMFDDFTIEEPESSVFPKTQYDLAKEIAAFANEIDFQPHFTVTTHSPYMLTAFNDLIKAGQVAKERPEKVSEIEQIIPREYWIRPGDFAAYAFDGKDGILRSIMDKDTGLIDGDTLDDVSDQMGGQFDELLDLQYGK